MKLTFTLTQEDAELTIDEVRDIVDQALRAKRTIQPKGRGTRYQSVERGDDQHTVTIDGHMVLHVSKNVEITK